MTDRFPNEKAPMTDQDKLEAAAKRIAELERALEEAHALLTKALDMHDRHVHELADALNLELVA